jgi:hypothetical protein
MNLVYLVIRLVGDNSLVIPMVELHCNGGLSSSPTYANTFDASVSLLLQKSQQIHFQRLICRYDERYKGMDNNYVMLFFMY